MEDNTIMIAIISATAGLLGSIIGATATLLAPVLNEKINRSGKVSLFAKIVGSASGSREFGFYDSTDEIIMIVPIWIEAINTCAVSRVLRNVSLFAYNDDKIVAGFVQIQKYQTLTETVPLGNNESYSIVIEANSI